ncbi:MAG: SIR2 family protein [Acidobacteriota bacterium]
MQKEPIELLLGAGVSVGAGLPSTREITSAILKGRWCPQFAEKASTCRDNDTLVAFLNILNTRLVRTKRECAEGSANYEELYYLIRVVRDHLGGQMVNAAVDPFCRQVWRSLKKKRGRNGDYARGREDLFGWATDLLKGIELTVQHLVSQKPNNWKSFQFIKQAAEAKLPVSLDIFTLCHDVALETFLNKEGIPFNDGFLSRETIVSRFDNQAQARRWSLEKATALTQDPVRLIKLHGSVDWFSHFPDNLWFKVLTGHVDTGLPRDLERCPILVGTFNKYVDYSRSIFRDAQCAFTMRLAKVNRVVVCGYSFGDQAINYALVEWMNGDHSRRLIVAHGEPQQLLGGARSILRQLWDDWSKQGRLIVLTKWAQDLSWDEIRGCL